MSIEKMRKKITDAIDSGVKRSNVDLSMISKKDKDSLFNEITDDVLMAFDTYISETEVEEKPDEKLLHSDETVLWKGRPFLSITESYVITSERIKVITGFLSRNVENFELIRIQDIDYKQNVGERMMGLGDITIRGHDASDPILVLRNIPKPEEVYELLRRSWLEARKKHGLQFREYM